MNKTEFKNKIKEKLEGKFFLSLKLKYTTMVERENADRIMAILYSREFLSEFSIKSYSVSRQFTKHPFIQLCIGRKGCFGINKDGHDTFRID